MLYAANPITTMFQLTCFLDDYCKAFPFVKGVLRYSNWVICNFLFNKFQEGKTSVSTKFNLREHLKLPKTDRSFTDFYVIPVA